MRELLKEARSFLVAIYGEPGKTIGSGEDVRRLISRIEDALSEPEPDAMEIVRKIREGATFGHDLSERYCKLLDTEAAALIESYGRRVPMTKEEPFDELGHGLC